MVKKILVIEDDIDYIEILKKWFCSKNFKLFFVKKELEALDILLNNPPDCILLDLNLPYLDGDEIISVFQSQNILGNIPIIINSARSEDEIKKVMLRIKASAYIQKPTDFDKLMKIIFSV